jgi:hypothetical protein
MTKAIFFSLLIIYWSSFVGAFDRTLILNLDVSGTLIFMDLSANKDLKLCLNTLLAKNNYYTWEKGGTMQSFYDFAKEKYPNDKKARVALLSNFFEKYKRTFPSLELDYLVLEDRAPKNDQPIFSSFFMMLSELERQNIKYHIVLRSYGVHLKDVTNTLAREKGFSFKFAEFDNDKLILESGKIIENHHEIAQYINETPFLAIQDHYESWEQAKNHWQFGKKFYFEPSDSILPLFFDDNIVLEMDENNNENIIRPINLSTGDVHPNKLVNETQIFKIDTYQAILDKWYYVDIISRVVAVHEKK